MVTFNLVLQLELQAMRKKHISLTAVAKDLGLKQNTFWRQMNDITPMRLGTIEKLEKAGYINIEQRYEKQKEGK